MKKKTLTKIQKPASTSGLAPKWNKNKSKSSASVQQNTNQKTEKGLTTQQSVKGMKFSVLVENVSSSTEVQSLLFHFRRFDPSASCTLVKQGLQDVTAVVGFSSKEKMEKVLSITHAIDCRLLKLTCEQQQQKPSKRPLEATGQDEQPSKKMCLISPRGHKICVEGLGTKTSQETVAEYFKRFGKVVEATVTVPGKGDSKKKVAFVSLAKENSAKAAASQKKHEIDGIRVTVRQVEGSEAQETEDANGARRSSTDSEDEGDEEESGEDEEESGEEEEESSDDDVQIQPQQRIKVQATAEDSGDEEDDDDDDDDNDDDDDDSDDEEDESD